MKMKKIFQFSYPISDEHFHEYEIQFPINIQGLDYPATLEMENVTI